MKNKIFTIVSSIGYVVLSGKIQVDKLENILINIKQNYFQNIFRFQLLPRYNFFNACFIGD